MNPIKHPSNTRELGAPKDWNETLPVESLGITDQLISGVPCVWSFWTPDADELAAINAGNPVILSIVGTTMPPALLLVAADHPPGAAQQNNEAEAAPRPARAGGWTDAEVEDVINALDDEIIRRRAADENDDFADVLQRAGTMIDVMRPTVPARAAGDAPQKYDETLLPFFQLMRRELHANAAKGDRPGWLGMEPQTCLLEIYWHVSKLSVAVRDGDPERIAEHTADVANMAMMQADIAGVLPAFAEPQAAAEEPTLARGKEWGMRLLAAATKEAVERGARKAYDDHYHKVRADIGYDDWLMVWQKAIAWWSGSVAALAAAPQPAAASVIGLGQGGLAVPANVDQRVAVPTPEAQEVEAALIDLGIDGGEHHFQPAGSALPHDAAPVMGDHHGTEALQPAAADPAGGVTPGAYLRKKADDFAKEHGYDDMGGLSFGRGAHAEAKLDYHSNLLELADELDVLTSTARPVEQPAASTVPPAADPCRPDLLERLTYHQLERDDLTVDECLSYLSQRGWKEVHGRTDRQMVMQILALLAAAPDGIGTSKEGGTA